MSDKQTPENAVDYKATLNLPGTEFAMKANLAVREVKWLEEWYADNIYQQIRTSRIGKKKYISVQADILKLKEQADKLQLELLALVEEDAKAFSPLAKAYGLPANTEEEKQEKAIVMEKALHNACAVPFKIMEKCCVAINIIHGFADKGSKIAISDAGCGVICCKAALKAASLNVFINTKLMKNKEYAQKINLQVENMLNTYIPEADKIYTQVENQVKN